MYDIYGQYLNNTYVNTAADVRFGLTTDGTSGGDTYQVRHSVASSRDSLARQLSCMWYPACTIYAHPTLASLTI